MTETPDIESMRPALVRQAYYITGTMADAADIVQDAYLQWTTIDKEKITNVRAYLMRMVANLAINFKKRQERHREAYFGQWLPEPVASEQADKMINKKDSISYSLMVMLERLSVQERAVFILKEAFDYDHREIAEVLDISPAYSRKLLSRAKSRIDSNRIATVTYEERIAFLDRFQQVIQSGNTDELELLLRADVSALSDGGGKASAGRHPVVGRQSVLRMLLGLYRKFYRAYTAQPVIICEQPAFLYWKSEVLVTCQVFMVNDGRLQETYLIRNPDKLARLQEKFGRRVT